MIRPWHKFDIPGKDWLAICFGDDDDCGGGVCVCVCAMAEGGLQMSMSAVDLWVKLKTETTM